MNIISFADNSTNIYAEALQIELINILEILELIDILMPSAPIEQKLSVDENKKQQFYYLANNPIDFLNERLPRYKEIMISIAAGVENENNKLKSLGDIIVILTCKILQFEIGRIWHFTNQKNFQSDKSVHNNNLMLIKDVKRILYDLDKFDKSQLGIIEAHKIDIVVIKLYNRLTSKSFIERVLSVFSR